MYSLSAHDARLARRLSWLAVLSLAVGGAIRAGGSPVLAAGPGDNGNGWPDGGPKSSATVDGNAAGGRRWRDHELGDRCSATGRPRTTSVAPSTLNKDFDAGSKIVVYLSANNGSNASPAANVSKNYAEIDVEDAGTYPFTLRHHRAVHRRRAGGVLIVFAVNDDGTVISSSKSNSLNCTESESTPTPTPVRRLSRRRCPRRRRRPCRRQRPRRS